MGLFYSLWYVIVYVMTLFTTEVLGTRIYVLGLDTIQTMIPFNNDTAPCI